MSLYEIGPFQLNGDRLTLHRDGRRVELGPKVVETLLALAEQAGEVCSKAWLLDRIWPEGFVQEANLAQNVYVLRKAFQRAGAPNPIVTVDGRGYRLTAPVRRLGAPARAVTRAFWPHWQRYTLALGTAVLSLVLPLLVSSTIAQRHAALGNSADYAGRLYNAGRYFWNLRTQDGVEKSLGLFASVIDREPLDARGYAGAAEANIALGEYCYGTHAPTLYFQRARAYAIRATELDPDSAEAHAALGFLALHQRDMATGVAELRRALAADFNNSEAHEWYGVALIRQGHRDRGQRELEKAHELAPLSVSPIALLAGVAYGDHEYARAIVYARAALELAPHRPDVMRIAGRAYEAQARFGAAVAAFTRYGAVDPFYQPEADALLARINARQGRFALARAQLALATAHPDHVVVSDLEAAAAALGMPTIARLRVSNEPVHAHGTSIEIAGTEKYS